MHDTKLLWHTRICVQLPSPPPHLYLLPQQVETVIPLQRGITACYVPWLSISAESIIPSWSNSQFWVLREPQYKCNFAQLVLILWRSITHWELVALPNKSHTPFDMFAFLSVCDWWFNSPLCPRGVTDPGTVVLTPWRSRSSAGSCCGGLSWTPCSDIIPATAACSPPLSCGTSWETKEKTLHWSTPRASYSHTSSMTGVGPAKQSSKAWENPQCFHLSTAFAATVMLYHLWCTIKWCVLCFCSKC